MASAARVASERIRQLDFIDTGELVDEFGRSIRLELDYQQEARNAETFRRNFSGDERIAVPRVWWRYTTGRLLTLDRLEGTHIRDLDFASWSADERQRARVHDDRRVDDDDLPSRFLPRRPAPGQHPPPGRRAARTHRLRPRRAADGERTWRGSRGCSSMRRPRTSGALPRRLADLGVRYPRDREEELRSRLEELYYRYYGSRLSDIDPIEAIREGLDLIYSMNLRLPVAIRDPRQGDRDARLRRRRRSIPDFNVFEVARPYARQLIAERFSPRRIALRTRRRGAGHRGDRARGAAADARRPQRAARRRDVGEDLESRHRRPRAPHGRRRQPDRRGARDPRRARRLVADRGAREGRAAPHRAPSRSPWSDSSSPARSASGCSGASSAPAASDATGRPALAAGGAASGLRRWTRQRAWDGAAGLRAAQRASEPTWRRWAHRVAHGAGRASTARAGTRRPR